MSEAHWVTAVAESHGLCEPGTVTLPPDADVAEAWGVVGEHCGITQQDLAMFVAQHYRMDLADLTTAQPAAIKMVPGDVARRFHVYPLRVDYRNIFVATFDPTDLELEQALGFASGRRPTIEVATPTELEEAIKEAYGDDLAMNTLLDTVDLEGADSVTVVESGGPEKVREAEVEIGPVVKLTNLIIREAIAQGASDIHIQPSATGGRVRFRVDGVLRSYMQMSLNALNRVVSRIKVISGLDIADRLRPQDGRTRVGIADRVYDLRVSTVPTREAEKAVVRILDPTGAAGLDGIGMDDNEMERLRTLLTHREGIVLVTGPTGSGKTTTLYAALRELATEDVNIITVEDPVEYELPGLTQIQVEEKTGVTFASALRAVLRQDPDVIFVGEIRDRETAEIAVQASLTGHLVLSTLHTNDAIGVVRRLTDLGLDIHSLNDTLRGAAAQRLARRLCDECREPIEGELTDEEVRLSRAYSVDPVARATGCDRCGGTGYRGRFPTAEVFVMTPEIQELILKAPTSTRLNDAAIKAGMRALRDGALERVRSGETSIQEIERVLGDVAQATRVSTILHRPMFDDAEGESEEEDSRPHVLLVDDDGAYRVVAKALLEKSGYRVTEADDGDVALERLKEKSDYSLMVLDLDMPTLGGHEVLSTVRSTTATAGMPVIVMTATMDPEAEITLIDAGADDYLRKPVDPNTFTVRVKATLRRAAS